MLDSLLSCLMLSKLCIILIQVRASKNNKDEFVNLVPVGGNLCVCKLRQTIESITRYGGHEAEALVPFLANVSQQPHIELLRDEKVVYIREARLSQHENCLAHMTEAVVAVEIPRKLEHLRDG